MIAVMSAWAPAMAPHLQVRPVVVPRGVRLRDMHDRAGCTVQTVSVTFSGQNDHRQIHLSCDNTKGAFDKHPSPRLRVILRQRRCIAAPAMRELMSSRESSFAPRLAMACSVAANIGPPKTCWVAIGQRTGRSISEISTV